MTKGLESRGLSYRQTMLRCDRTNPANKSTVNRFPSFGLSTPSVGLGEVASTRKGISGAMFYEKEEGEKKT